MSEATAAFVQFPHPGREKALPSPGHYPWTKNAPHGRKFMRVEARPGSDASGEGPRASMTIWGEWEGDSRVVSVWGRGGGLPESLHVPVTAHPPPGFRQNTDPWVFGPQFRYSNCKQLLPSGRPSRLQELPTGSVIVFGSGLAGGFVVDTVFVVREAVSAPLAEHLEREADATFRTHVLESLATDSKHGVGWLMSRPLTLYRGATPADPIEGMFSFVPAIPGMDGRFGRPSVRVSIRGRDLINPANWQAPAGSGAESRLPVADVAMAWRSVAEQVQAHDLELAWDLLTPDADDRLLRT